MIGDVTQTERKHLTPRERNIEHLFCGDLHVADIVSGDGDFPWMRGTYELMRPKSDSELFRAIEAYIAFSEQDTCLAIDETADPDGSIHDQFRAANVGKHNLCENAEWRLVDLIGRETKILVPAFGPDHEISWCFQ